MRTKLSIHSFTLIALFVVIYGCASLRVASAATLSLAPVTSSVSAGDIVPVKIQVSTDGIAINAGDILLQFPTDLLEVLSVSKSSSVFSLWVQEPQFSNVAGTISFDGGVPNPGFTGSSGTLATITFKAKKSGTASILFSDSAVRANDGLGTNVLTATRGATIAIAASDVFEVPKASVPLDGLPPQPVVISSTNPQQDVWYTDRTVSFSWIVPSGVTALQTLVTKNPDALPNVKYDSSVSQRTVNDLADGTFYFRIRYQNSVGWGPIATYKVHIDQTPPNKFSLAVQTRGVDASVALNAVDSASGIDYYSVQIDDAPAVRVAPSSLLNGRYTLPTQMEGSHDLTVVAYDRAGNSTKAEASFVSPAIAAPVVSVDPDRVMRGGSVTFSGTTEYPASQIEITVRPSSGSPKTYTTKTANDGSFRLVSDALNASGRTSVSARLSFSASVQSPVSNTAIVQVEETALARTGRDIIYGLSFIVPIAVMIIGLIFLVYLGWHKFFGLRRKLGKETASLVNDMHKALMAFKDELGDQLAKLEKIKVDRDLNKKEEKIFKELENNIDSIDEFIEKKLKKMR